MKTITVPSKDQVSPQAQAIFEQITKKIGKVPNLYATIGYSASTLKAMLDFEESFADSTFLPKEREAVNLVVSQVNRCNYCLAAHTLLATMKGYSKEETLSLRKADAADAKLKSALQLAKAMAENKGEAPKNYLSAFFDAGYDEKALIELIGLVALRTFTNYVYALTEIPIDFPAAEPLA